MSFISKNYLERLKNHLNQRITEIQSMNPVKNIHDLSNQLEVIKANLLNSIQYNKNIKEQSLSITLAKLDGASPLHALSRGYAFVSDSKTKKSIKSIADISIGTVVQTQLQDGIFESKVSDLKKDKK
jgi:exodeoxyribonuclease VII large subunit